MILSLLWAEVPATLGLNKPLLAKEFASEITGASSEAAVTLTLGEVCTLVTTLPAILAGADGTPLDGIPSLIEAGLPDVPEIHSGRPNTGANLAVLVDVEVVHVPIACHLVVCRRRVSVDPVFVYVDLVQLLQLSHKP